MQTQELLLLVVNLVRIPGHVNNGFRADVNNRFRGQVNEDLGPSGIFIRIPE